MKLIVGLGNPGKKYEQNRHNVGFMFVNILSRILREHHTIGKDFEHNDRFGASLLEIGRGNDKILLAKPSLFMNRSGEAVRKIRDFYKIENQDIIVAHDDLDIPLGMFKVQLASGPKMHNGITSVEQHLGTIDFWRVRIGIENRKGVRIPGEAYVLQDFSAEERETIDQSFAEIAKRLDIQ